jgi:hypothetical protein
METSEFNAELTAQQLGTAGVENLVTNAERICTYEQQRIELSNLGPILGLQGEYQLLVAEEQRLEERLKMAPPPGDLRRIRLRAVINWCVLGLLTIAGFALTMVTFAPFRFGWKGWLYCAGIAIVTPFLLDKLLDFANMEKALKVITMLATVAALASLMFLAIIRGDLLAQQIRQDAAPVVVIDDSAPQPEPQNNFYGSTVALLRLAMLLTAFSLEAAAGLALREAWRSSPDTSEDWAKLRAELVATRRLMVEIVSRATMLHNEPRIFANRFWRDFYRALLSNAARKAMTKLLVIGVGIVLLGSQRAHAEDRLNLVIALDLTRSVATVGPDGKSDFEKNVDGVTMVLARAVAGTRVSVIGITDHSFTQPYILLSARVPEDPGYFGERLNAARSRLIAAWKQRAAKLSPSFPHTDILGALRLASQLFAQEAGAEKKSLVIFSDMRQSTTELDLESLRIVPPFQSLARRCDPLPDLSGVLVDIAGVDGSGKSQVFWESLEAFWKGYFLDGGVSTLSYSTLREVQIKVH